MATARPEVGIPDKNELPSKEELAEFFYNGKTKDIEAQNKNDTCSICLEVFGANENVSVLVLCGHIFHKKCIMDWVNRKFCCPNCKFQIKKSRTEKASERKKEIQNKSIQNQKELEEIVLENAIKIKEKEEEGIVSSGQ